MITHRVGSLDLTVVRPRLGPDRQSAVERFVSEVIERAGNELERRFPGRVFAVKTLALYWSLRAGELTSPGAIERYARELAGALEELPEGWSRSPEFGEVYISRDRARFWTSYVRTKTVGSADRLWAFEGIASAANPLQDLADQHDAALTQDVIRTVAADDLQLLSKLLSVAVAEALIRQLALTNASPKPIQPGDAALLETAAARLNSEQLPASPSVRVVLAYAYLLAFRQHIASPAQARDLAVQLAALTNPAGSTADAPFGAEQVRSTSAQEKGEAPIFTRFGGLFYLTNVLLELNAGEILWKACVDERAFFRAMFLAIAGVDDPAIELLSGADPDDHPAATVHQGDEIVALLPHAPGWIAVDPDAAPRITAVLANAVLRRFVERLELDYLPSLDQVRKLLAIRGRLIVLDGELHLMLPLDAIELPVRRAGLDRDPGWIPWIERKVRIVFDDSGAEF